MSVIKAIFNGVSGQMKWLEMDEWIDTWIFIFMVTVYLLKRTCSGIYFLEEGRLDDKVIVVTGANSGIGYETALELARRGASVIVACRDRQRGLKAESSIKEATNSSAVRFRQLDLGSFKSIRTFAKTIKLEEESLYALINNAGVFWCDFSTTQDGFELNFGVNYLGHFLLTMLLLPLLSNCQYGGRVVTVSSIMHIFGRLDLNQLSVQKHNYNFVKAYSDSKLASVLFTKELTRRLKLSRVTTYCADPGIVSTNIGRESKLMGSYFYRVLLIPLRWLFFKSALGGSQTVLYCVCSSSPLKYSGSCFSECEHRRAWPSAVDEYTSSELWAESVKLANLSENDMKWCA